MASVMAANDFDQSATFSGKTINVAFDNAFVSADVGTGVESSAPGFETLSSDVEGLIHGTAIVVTDAGTETTYYVVGIEDGGAAMTQVILSQHKEA